MIKIGHRLSVVCIAVLLAACGALDATARRERTSEAGPPSRKTETGSPPAPIADGTDPVASPAPSAVDVETLAAPARKFLVSFAELSTFHAECNGLAAASTLDCLAAYDNYCRPRGFVGGIGPLNYSPENVELACFSSDAAQAFGALLAEVPEFVAVGCTPGDVESFACKAAASRYCARQTGFVTGYGPVQLSGTAAMFVCMKSGAASFVQRSDAAVRLYDRLDFDLAYATQSLSMVAATRTCQDAEGPNRFSIGIVEGDHPSRSFTAACVGERSPEAKITTLADIWDKFATPMASFPPSLDFNCVGCGVNTTRFTRPTASMTGLTRQLDGVEPHWSISQVRWEKTAAGFTQQFLGRILDTRDGGAKIDDGRELISDAFDPATEFFNATHWVAFECSGAGPTSSVCIGPFRDNQLNPAEVYVIARAVVANGHTYSASVPKLLVWHGRFFLYWTQVKLTLPPESAFVSLSTQGVELHMGPDGRLQRTSAIHSWTFEANGGIGEADWILDGDHWVLDAEGTLPDGVALIQTNILSRVNNDTFTWQSTNRLLDGHEIPDLAPVKVMRIPSKK